MLKRLAIFAALLLSAPMVTGQPNKAADYKQRAATQGQPAVITADSPNKQLNGQRDQPKPSLPEWYASLERPDWWLVIAAFLTLGTICWQSVETRRAARATQQSVAAITLQTQHLADSVVAAKRAAEAAEISAKAAMGLSLPWIGLCKFSFVSRMEGASEEMFYQFPGARVELKNFGQSPAFMLRYAGAFGWDDDPPSYQSYLFDGEEIIEPGGTLKIDEWRFAGELPDEAAAAEMVKGKKILKFSFWATYGDVFDSPVKRFEFERYLIEYDPDPKKMGVTIRQYAQVFWEEGKGNQQNDEQPN